MTRFKIEALLSRERERSFGADCIYHRIISIENLLGAWREFLPGKRKRKDVALFSLNLMDNILLLHHELVQKTYIHGPYYAFRINDPKPRNIHKASVRDRLLHHAIYRVLYPRFDSKFIFDSFSCRDNKGTYGGIRRLNSYARKVSHNSTRTVWILKCDIKRFFDNIDHEVLKNILKKYIEDQDVIWLLSIVIDSFSVKDRPGVGLPLGNLTSQLLVNIYMNEFDHFTKRNLGIKYYIRYADDFVILHNDRRYLEKVLPQISSFLETKLKLSLHPNKILIRTLSSGLDFLGWVNFNHHRVLRTATKKRMFRMIKNPKPGTVTSYLGMLGHGNAYKMSQKIKEN